MSYSKKTRVLECVYCGAKLTQYNIGMHVKKYHNVDPETYRLENGIKLSNADREYFKLLRHIERKVDVFMKNNSNIDSDFVFNYIFLCHKFDIKYNKNRLEWMLEYFDYGYDIDEYINHTLALLNYTGPKFSTHEWLCMTKGEAYADNIFKEKSESNKGHKNVFYNHGGKLSPFSKNYYKYDNMSEDEKEIVIRKKFNDFHQKMDRENKYNTRIEWYLNKGYSLEEAQEKLSNRQRTFTLEKCIGRYGVEKGTEIWEERQIKWQNTLNSKSTEEILNINSSKSSTPKWLNFQSDLLHNKNVYGIFYILQINDRFVKLGITTRSLNRRYKQDILDKCEGTFVSNRYTAKKIFLIEQILRITFNNHKIKKYESIENFGWTETYKDISIDVIKDKLLEIEHLDENELLGLYENIR